MTESPAPVETTELGITGMTCASCVLHVNRALERVPGVTHAAVNLATEHATVAHGPNVDAAALVAAVEAAGYGAAPIVASVDADDADAQRRDRDITTRGRLLAFGIALFVPTMLLGMLAPEFAGKDLVMLALAIPVWAIVGWPFHRNAFVRALHATADMDTLVSLGSTAALAYSVYAAFAHVPGFAESASGIVVLISVGKYLEVVARGRSNRALRALLDLRPPTARLRESGGATRTVPVASLHAGDVVVVAAGERVPVDGVVVDGASAIDVSMLTGEPMPLEVAPGADVHAGTVNGDGTFAMRATAVGDATVLARIVDIVRAAQGSTPPVQRLADRVAAVFVPAILAVAALTFVGWVATAHPWSHALAVAVAVLVVACPCALGLATPMAIIVGVGRGAQRGVLFKDASALERLGNVDTVVFDKTGTLTIGHPTVIGTRLAAGADASALLAIAAAVERDSTHPLARAIRTAAPVIAGASHDVRDVVADRGRGIRANVDGREAYVGTAEFLRAAGIDVAALATPPRVASATAVYVAHDARLLGAIDIADALRPTSADAVRDLRALRVEPLMVSGDGTAAVAAAAREVGIERSFGERQPDEKAAIVRELHGRGRRVAFVGDGINDAPALAVADVGIAMGGGTNVAMETAQAAILSNDPAAVAVAIRLSRATMRKVSENLFWAFAYNAVLIPLAAAGRIEPLYAAAAMGLSSLFVVGNSLLLRRFS